MTVTAHCVWGRANCNLAGKQRVYMRGDRGFKYSDPDYTAPEKFENAPITGYFRFVFEENWVREIT